MFAHPRSGSNSLVEILRRHPSLSILNEPFNEGFPSWGTGKPNYLARVRDVESLEDLLREIFAEYRGMKMLSYQLGQELGSYILRRSAMRVVFLRRRNLLQAAVSNLYRAPDGSLEDVGRYSPS